MQDGDVVGELEHHFHVVLDQQHAQIAFRQHVLEDLHGPAGLLDRQALGRLVQHQQARLLRDRHRDLEQALVAVREHGGGRIGHTGEPHARNRLVGGRGRPAQHAAAAEELPAPAIPRLGRNAHVLAHGQGGKDVAELEGARDSLLRHLMDRHSGDVLAGEDHLPSARLEHAGDQVEDGGLAGAVGPDHGANLAGLHRQVDAIDGHQGAEAADQTPAFKQRHRVPPWRRRSSGSRACI